MDSGTLAAPADLKAGAAAADKLAERLTAVWQELIEAGDPLADPEVVHRLRVATRRSLAAVAAFEPLLPRKKSRAFKRRLRLIRRAAGEARDLDVLVDRLRQRWPVPTAGAPEAGRVIGLLAEQQTASRGPIRECWAELTSWDWPARQARLLKLLAELDSPRYVRFARRQMRLAGRQFFATTGPFRRAAQLHQFRIRGKRLRYSLDLFADALNPRPQARCLKRLKQMQEALGDFTDHTAAAARFGELANKFPDSETAEFVDSLRREERRLARLARRRFNRWWTDQRRQTLKRLLRKAVTP